VNPATSASRSIPVNNDPPPSLRRSRPSLSSAPGGNTEDNQTESAILQPRQGDDRGQRDNRPPATNPAPAPLPSIQTPSAMPPYNGPRSGTLESTIALIPQNGEYVFRDLPLAKLQLDYNSKVWEARLVPGEGQTQRLIVKNKSSGPQKRCVVHWSVVP
jgi:hypothetical protein